MKQMTVSFQDELAAGDLLSNVANRLRQLEKQVLCFTPWAKTYACKPDVKFILAYGTDSLFLQFDVKEKFIRAAYGNMNEPVYKDSCVEFFLSFDNGGAYYNFEFNCIGTVLAAFGKERTNRKPLPLQAVEFIKSQSLIRRGEGEMITWELTVALPLTVFLYQPLSSLQGRRCKANFYKCGDDLPEPHFLSWSNIESAEPNFHLPQFFGELHFA